MEENDWEGLKDGRRIKELKGGRWMVKGGDVVKQGYLWIRGVLGVLYLLGDGRE